MRSTHRCPPRPPRPDRGGEAWRLRQSRGLEPSGGAVAATVQAQALCDLVADPRSGITRVVVVGAPPGLPAAVAEAAAGCGVVATVSGHESGPGAPDDGRVTLRRPGPAGGTAQPGRTS